MAQFTKSPFVALAAFLLLHLTLLSSQQTLVQAGPYSFQTPTGATRWTVGQVGLINIVSKEHAEAKTLPDDKLFKVTLERRKGGLFGGRTTMTTIRDRVQLLIPAANPQQTEVTLDINDWLVPANVPAGDNYFVRLELEKGGFLGFKESAETPEFQIVGAPTPGNTTATMTMTNTLATPTATTASIAPTPTSTCLDVKEQCASQGKVYQEATASSPCTCGADLIIPTIVPNGASGSIKSTVKSTFKSTGGPTAAFAVLILVIMTLF
ncbi:hypothetical protein BGZ75_002057 [Mortierella antarctica]|nr:hypothetical protein BGZ67_001007 [Mortierella alpina]KAF9986253.1 hypothetical protein BGZ75_002057 [Mortierella antarctica]